MSICPVNSGLFDKTVTVYRKQGEEVLRQVIENCYLCYEDILQTDLSGCRKGRKFSLILPGEGPVLPGDRVFAGVGPEVSLEQWDSFIPVKVAKLMEVSCAKAYSWDGKTSHVEAGGQ